MVRLVFLRCQRSADLARDKSVCLSKSRIGKSASSSLSVSRLCSTFTLNAGLGASGVPPIGLYCAAEPTHEAATAVFAPDGVTITCHDCGHRSDCQIRRSS
jgi:hypothetical protein